MIGVVALTPSAEQETRNHVEGVVNHYNCLANHCIHRLSNRDDLRQRAEPQGRERDMQVGGALAQGHGSYAYSGFIYLH
jgi:hypothetical protein